jgi:hypothetical protein
MTFDEDIPIGEGLSDYLDDALSSRRASEQAAGNRFDLGVALTVSISIHLLLAFVLLQLSVGSIKTPSQAPASTVQIRLLAPAVFGPIRFADPELETGAVSSEGSLQEVQQQEHEQAQLEKPAPTTLVDIPAIDVTPGPSTPADPIQPGVFAPSIVTVIESIQALKATQAQRYWSSDCNRLQVEVGLRDCEPKDRNNYALLKRNRTYEALNPVRQLTRTQRSLSVVSRQALALAAELEAGTIEPGLAEYLVQEIEAGITQLADPGNRAVQNMGRMDTSAAAVMKRRILQDPWVQSRTKQLQQRRVHTN